MPTFGNDAHAMGKLLEITLLRRSERVPAEERNNDLQQVFSPTDDELAQVLAMIVVPLTDVDLPDSEESLQFFQRGAASHALRHDKLVRHLIAGPVASAPRSVRLPNETDGEASLSVYKANNPA